MSESHPLAPSALDREWPRRRGVLGRCLLLVALLLCAVGAVSVPVPLVGPPTLTPLQVGALVGGAVWLLVAYLIARLASTAIGGGMIVALGVAAPALLIYLLPNYLAALLPLALLPPALAALLLGRTAAYSVAVLTLLALAGAGSAASRFPPPSVTVALPPPSSPALLLTVGALALLLLALLLDPLRTLSDRLRGELHQRDAQIARLTLQQRETEAARDSEAARRKRREHYLDTLLLHNSDGVVDVEPTGLVLRANATARAIWALVSDRDLVGMDFGQVQDALSGPRDSSRYIEALPLPLDGTEGSSYLLRDRREQARLARLRGELMAQLTDEMRNPLTSMLTALDLVLGQQDLPEDLDRVLIGARRSGQRLLDLVTVLLEINQIEQNPTVLRRSPTSLTRVLEAGIAQMAPVAQQGAVTVAVEFGGDSILPLDSERMQRAFVYLLEYAVRRSPPYSSVYVRTTRRSSAVEVRVTDQGPALAPEQRAALFDHRANTADRGAPALGLAFCRLVIETHGGRVWSEDAEGQGNTIAFALPLPKENA
ncbi:MAG TPA: HAMP domain-containing sensor histidine kinase [Roseiflexaceae bacterium]|nr:HAMP domain-containing sensor histidine kinase [Roseiflexaceae bacterium]